MEWNEFVENVQRWAAERGIYEHSTPDAQLLKALSELGELADAYAKQDTAGVIDGIGDVLVCLVNYQTMVGGSMTPPVSGEARIGPWTGGAERAIGQMAVSIGAYLGEEDNKELLPFLATGMIVFSDCYMKVNITECLQVAWDAIKERRGRMIPGGVFVKTDDESLKWASDILKKATPEEIEQALAELDEYDQEERLKRGEDYDE